ncbi:MAG: 5'-3' exonuclease [Actinomycetota bacterium]
MSDSAPDHSHPDRVLLLDSASLYFRAFFGVPERMQAPDGTPTNAVRGFLDMVSTLITTLRPRSVLACWDDDWRPAFRVAAIPSYKSHRVADRTIGDEGGVPSGEVAVQEEIPAALAVQVPIIVDVLAAVGITQVGHPGYEADDVIATVADQSATTGLAVDIVTGDRDLFQLVHDARRIRVLYTARGGVRNLDYVDQNWLRDRYGIEDGQQYATLAAVRGDPSDGLPGVPGIGEKGAAQLARRVGSLSGLLAAVNSPEGSLLTAAHQGRLRAAWDYLQVAPTVVQLVRDVPLPQTLNQLLLLPPADLTAMAALQDRWGMKTSINRLFAAINPLRQ